MLLGFVEDVRICTDLSVKDYSEMGDVHSDELEGDDESNCNDVDVEVTSPCGKVTITWDGMCWSRELVLQ